ncbi:hypothetical protein [Nocardia sp. NPDC048505]|uniref:hypothetical protein n=1 Tax=unclassified Nocardia TaxID=2637762 RepID=UPI0033EEC2E2
MRRDANLAALVLCGALLGPVAGGQLALLGKPLGGVLGVPGEVVGYLAITALVIGCATAFLVTGGRYRAAGVCALLAGLAYLTAGLTARPWLFTAAVLVAGAATGPALAAGRTLALARGGRARTAWHGAMVAGAVLAAGTAVLCDRRPGTALLIVGALAAGTGLLAVLTSESAARAPGSAPAGSETAVRTSESAIGGVAPASESAPTSMLPGRVLEVAARTSKAVAAQRLAAWRMKLAGSCRFLATGAVAGLLAGGTVLPGLHLLLFRFDAVGSEQTIWLLWATLPALLAVALPGPDPGAVPMLLVIACGGPILVATAPGRASLAVGIAVTLVAVVRTLRGVDLLLGDVVPHPATAWATLLAPIAAGLAGLGLVTVCAPLFGTGSGLLVLAAAGLLAVLGLRRVTSTPLVKEMP